MLKKLLFIIILTAVTNTFADEAMRVNMKSAIVKGCSESAAKDQALKGLNTNEYCTCSSNGLIDGLSDAELKQVFLAGDKALMQTRMTNAATLCMSTNSGASVFIKSAMYNGCIEKPTADNDMVDKEAYCSCVADKFTEHLSQEDMRDFLAIGQKTSALMDTKVADKVMGVAADCLNKTVK